MKVHEEWTIAGKKLPIEISWERRRSWRLALGSKAVQFRLPKSRKTVPERARHWARNWLTQKMLEEPRLFARYLLPLPQDGQIYHTHYGSLRLNFQSTNRKLAKVEVRESNLQIYLPDSASEDEINNALRSLVSKGFVLAFSTQFKGDLARMNQTHFNLSYQQVRLKYTKSNWGSCSAKKNLNFSTRLLLLPYPMMEYIIIHELAHLQELNHSPAFWQLVESACPDYKDRELWLRQHGAQIDF